MFPYSLIPALLLVGAAAAPKAHAQAAETFTHWEAECADALCVAHTVTPGGVVSLRILREDGPDAPWEIAFAGIQNDVKEGTPIDVSVDGSRPMRFTEDHYAAEGGRVALTEPERSADLFAMLLRGNKATLAFTHRSGVPLRLNFSLAGLGAATRWIEEHQGGGAAEDRPPETSEAPAETPEQTPPPPEEPANTAQSPESPQPPEATPSAEPAEVPDLVSARHTEDGVCKDYDAEHLFSSRVVDKPDEDHTLYLLPCYAGAYNVVYRIWIADSRQPEEVKRSLFAGYSDEQGWYGTDQLINAEYDPATKMLSAFEKGRGIGDCGSMPTYQWHSGGWRMMEYRYWGKCDGTRKPDDWPVIFEHPEK